MNTQQLIIELHNHHLRGSRWLDTVPPEINSVFFDNTYVDSLQQCLEIMMKAHFSDELLQELQWFLYEWDKDHPIALRTITFPDNTTYIINNVQDYIEYLQRQGYCK